MLHKKQVLILLTLIFISAGSFLIWSGIRNTNDIPVITATTVLNPQENITSPSPVDSGIVQGIEGERAIVTKVVDGDTIEVNLNGKEEKIRMVGMDTPETKDPRRPVGCFGKEASNETESLLDGKMVILQKDVTERDKFGRLLRYIYLPLGNGQTLFVNDYLVRTGFAKVYTYPPDIKYNEQFLKAQQVAKEAKKGLWGKC